MKKRKIFYMLLILIPLAVMYIYISNITLFPTDITIFNGEKINLTMLLGINIKQTSSTNPNLQTLENKKTIQVSNIENEESDQTGTINLSLNLFGAIPVKNVDVNVISKTKVIPLGNTIGLKLYTNGVLVVGMSEIESENNQKIKPYENSGIQEGDMIININEKQIFSTQELIENVNNSKGESIKIKYVRNNDVLETSIRPVKSAKEEYKLGLWVRDAAAGVGTATFYEESTNSFAALGHGIVDIDTEKLINISKGEVVQANILSINKGIKR